MSMDAKKFMGIKNLRICFKTLEVNKCFDKGRKRL